MTHSNSVSKSEGGMDRFFTAFATHVAKWTGSHWTFAIVAVLVVVSLVTIGWRTPTSRSPSRPC